jgi:hypothetical protein
MASVSDSLGGVTNLTLYVPMTPAPSFSTQDFINMWESV